MKTYIVKDADGSLLGVFYSDYMPRASKRSGAWMSNFREQQEGAWKAECRGLQQLCEGIQGYEQKDRQGAVSCAVSHVIAPGLNA